MKTLPFLAIGAALLLSSCASRYSSLPPDAGATPNPDVLLKAMSTRLASAKNYRFTASNTIAREVAEATHQQPNNDVEVVVSRTAIFEAKYGQKGIVSAANGSHANNLPPVQFSPTPPPQKTPGLTFPPGFPSSPGPGKRLSKPPLPEPASPWTPVTALKT